jgi:diguanylate cyclase (GGDEF)-like protein/PAS domain S-box-containing protein
VQTANRDAFNSAPRPWQDGYRTAIARLRPLHDPRAAEQNREPMRSTPVGQPTRDAALERSEQRFRSIVQSADDLIAIMDADGAVQYASAAAGRALGVPVARLVGARGFDLVHPHDVARCRAVYATVVARPGSSRRLAVRAHAAGGRWRRFDLVFTNRFADPAVRGVLVSGREITEHGQRQQLSQQQASFDAVTGLPNRLLFHDRLERACAHARCRGAVLALILLDVDHFRAVNDLLGMQGGDTLLSMIGRRLAGALRAADTVTRAGGDEFAILLEELNGPSGPRHVAERIIDVLREPFRIGEREVALTFSIGIALAAGDATTPADLLRHADVALRQAKADGRASFVVFDARVDGPALQRLLIEAELRGSLERDELRVHYQPEVDVQTRTVVGVEALVRWQHPHRGLIGPAEFIPLAEETGFIDRIDRWVLERACRQAVTWQALRPSAPLVLSVNLSARELRHVSIVDDVARVLRDTGLDPHHLRLEITESAVIEDLDAAEQVLSGLTRLGVRIAVDDFGTGYSSLSYLHRFPVTTLKIDREFVHSLDTDASAETIVRAVAAMGHGLGMDVTLEGVETPRQLELARRLDCDRVQGNLFWSPLPGEAITEILAHVGGV